jgi:DNA-binding LytR/AlgR family response regulator
MNEQIRKQPEYVRIDMIRTAIVEDDTTSLKIIKKYLERYLKEQNMVGKIECFPDALDFISDYSSNFDVVFMDIEMPHLNGMDAAKKLRMIDKEIFLIFVTNMTNYAVKSYEVDAMGYMVKPINYFSLSVLMDKVRECMDTRNSQELYIKNENYFKRIMIKDLYYIESYGHYLVYHTKDGDYMELGQIGKMEKQLLNDNFFRCNKCYLVNLEFVMEIKEDIVKVGKEDLKISRRRKKEFLIALNEFYGE